jgi:transcriptional regulator with XRE-family HTH domain
MDNFGKLVRDRRKQEKLNQEELSQNVGISRNYLSQIERGEATNLSWQVRKALAAALGLDPGAQGADGDEPGLPEGLEAFAQRVKLPPDDVKMLAGLRYRGKQPTTPDKWELLYNVIKMTTTA